MKTTITAISDKNIESFFANQSINENHRRGISSTLILLDEMLCMFENWAKGEAGCGILYREINDLNDSQIKSLLRRISALRNLIGEMRDRLSLSDKTIQLSGKIWAQSSAFSNHLIELESKYLRGYGEIAADAVRYLDAQSHKLVSELKGITKIFKK
ncbi:hypothetical protein JW926_02540 [Candidatus Sumerlaeota bacterium]|nr:hypothetical protein [Candidatus Sumerlaeota bacterium]